MAGLLLFLGCSDCPVSPLYLHPKVFIPTTYAGEIHRTAKYVLGDKCGMVSVDYCATFGRGRFGAAERGFPQSVQVIGGAPVKCFSYQHFFPVEIPGLISGGQSSSVRYAVFTRIGERMNTAG